MADTEKLNDKDLAPEDGCDAKRDGLFCTLPKGHKGEHIAEGSIGRVHARWSQPAEPSPPSTDLAREAAEKITQYSRYGGEYRCPDTEVMAKAISEVYAPLDTQIANYQRDLMHKSIELASLRQEREQLIGDLQAVVQDYTEQSQAVRELLEVVGQGISACPRCRDARTAAERLRKLREGIPQPQRLSREQLIAKAYEFWKKHPSQPGYTFHFAADFALSLAEESR